MKKKLLALLLCISLTGSVLAGCGSAASSSGGQAPSSSAPAAAVQESAPKDAPAPASESKKVMLVSIVTGGVAWGAAQKGFEDAISDLGWEGQYVSPMQANDTAGVVNLLETAVTNNSDAILSVILDPEQVVDVFSRAKEKNTALITLNTLTTPEMQDCWIGTDPVGMGKAQAQAILNGYKGSNPTVAYIQTLLTIPTQNQQYAAMQEVIKEKYPDAVFIQDECDSNAQTAADKASALKKAYPELDVIVCADGYGATGIANFIESDGYQAEILGIGIDDSEEMLNYVKNGVMNCTIAQDFYNMGYEGVMLAKTVMDGGSVDFANDSGTITITADKVDAHFDLLRERGLVK